jgi:hypothetical protein
MQTAENTWDFRSLAFSSYISYYNARNRRKPTNWAEVQLKALGLVDCVCAAVKPQFFIKLTVSKATKQQ